MDDWVSDGENAAFTHKRYSVFLSEYISKLNLNSILNFTLLCLILHFSTFNSFSYTNFVRESKLIEIFLSNHKQLLSMRHMALSI